MATYKGPKKRKPGEVSDVRSGNPMEDRPSQYGGYQFYKRTPRDGSWGPALSSNSGYAPPRGPYGKSPYTGRRA